MRNALHVDVPESAGDLFIGFLFSILMIALAIDGWVAYLGF